MVVPALLLTHRIGNAGDVVYYGVLYVFLIQSVAQLCMTNVRERWWRGGICCWQVVGEMAL